MSDLFWLSDEQMDRLRSFFPKPHGRPCVDDRRVLSGIIFVNRNGLRWRDAPKAYGPPKTLYNRVVRWSRMGIFARMLLELAGDGDQRDTLMIDATHLKAHRTASSLRRKNRQRQDDWPYERRHELKATRSDGWLWPTGRAVSERWQCQRLHRGCGTFTIYVGGEMAAGGSGL